MGLGIRRYANYLGMGSAIRGMRGLDYDYRLVAGLGSGLGLGQASNGALWFAFTKRRVLMTVGGAGLLQRAGHRFDAL